MVLAHCEKYGARCPAVLHRVHRQNVTEAGVIHL
jgi:hypothetical protein